MSTRAPLQSIVGLAVAAALVVVFGGVALTLVARQAYSAHDEGRQIAIISHVIDHKFTHLRTDVGIAAAETTTEQAAQKSLRHDFAIRMRAGETAPATPSVEASQFLASGGQMLVEQARKAGRPISAAIAGDGRAWMAAATPWGPDGDVLTTVERVDDEFMSELRNGYGVINPRLVLGGADPVGLLISPLKNPVGEQVAAVGWRPEFLGARLFYRAKWYFLFSFTVLAGIVWALMHRIKLLSDDLIRAREQAERADAAKSDFLANMSHEIRTPLNGVIGMTQAMSADELSPAQRERVRVIRESSDTLLNVLNDVLDLAKIEAGRLDLTLASFDLVDLVETARAAFAPVAGQKSVSVTTMVREDVRGSWSGDAMRIRQVLSNLLSNAVKFTASGEVTISVATHAEGLVFSVRDTGIGIDAARAPDLFEKFAQADASTTRRYGGTGLGLSICRELVELMGGRIWVESASGKGSTFSFVLPLKRASAAPIIERAADTEASDVAQDLRILAAEDNPTNQLVLTSLLAPLGAKLVMVADGAEAVRAFKRTRFDMILMDVQMPEMNGVEATKAIRALEIAEKRPRTPIIALSANVMAHQLREYTDAGMDGHVAKPIEVARLYAAVASAVDIPTASAA